MEMGHIAWWEWTCPARRKSGASPSPVHTAELYGALRERLMCISCEPPPSSSPRFHSRNSLNNRNNLLKVSGPTTLAPRLVPTSPDRWSPRPEMEWLLSPRTALRSNPGGPCPFGFCYHFHLTATSVFGYNSASLGSHTESKVCTPGVSENSYVWL